MNNTRTLTLRLSGEEPVMLERLIDSEPDIKTASKSEMFRKLLEEADEVGDYEIRYTGSRESKAVKVCTIEAACELNALHAFVTTKGSGLNILTIEQVNRRQCERCLIQLPEDKEMRGHICRPTQRFRKMEDRILELEADSAKLKKRRAKDIATIKRLRG